MNSLQEQLDACVADVDLPAQPRVAVTLAERGTVIARHWHATHDDDRFEVGSVSKAFLGLAVAVAVEKGVVTLDAEAQRGVSRGGDVVPLSLRDLVTHTSGVKRQPPGITPWRVLPSVLLGKDPYRRVRWAYDPTTPLPLDKPGEYAYSNLGAGVVGGYLAAAFGRPFDDVVREFVLQPLGMLDTAVQTDDHRVKKGFASSTGRCSTWVLGSLAPAGGWVSTPADMARFAERLSAADVPGSAAWEPLAPHGERGQVGMFWMTSPLASDGPPVVWHNGALGGYCAYVGYRPDCGRAVTVMLNRGLYRSKGALFDPRTLGEAILRLKLSA